MIKKEDDKKNILVQIIQVLSEQLGAGASNINGSSLLVDDLGMDSFGAVELVFALNSKFGIEISQDDFREVKTVSSIVDYIALKIKD